MRVYPDDSDTLVAQSLLHPQPRAGADFEEGLALLQIHLRQGIFHRRPVVLGHKVDNDLAEQPVLGQRQIPREVLMEDLEASCESDSGSC
eukprot:CAMPEP_0180208138 /NCGR_PEP_ID=MMETSP0987-20121128/10573_1 /TAXON_ID=697907 /ORGANISM="non described non described, Strain CCMP2293" /LENGTH=89 /DNA_ID=CAMNT_0022164251 /DNA_START=585 /DNA_END=855 /DNA_ORIENTATION=-